MIGVTNEKISKVIDMADSAVSEMLTKVGDFETSVEAAETYKRKIETLINSL